MIKLLHTADIHLDGAFRFLGERGQAHRQQIQATFDRIIDLAHQDGYHLLLITGDLFDGPHPTRRTVEAVPLADAVVQDIQRLAGRQLLPTVKDGEAASTPDGTLTPAPAVIETPVYRREAGLWAHPKVFVKTVFDAHRGPLGQARFVLADQVGLGKTLQLAMSAQLIALTGTQPILIICPKTLVWQWQNEMNDLLDMPSAVWDGRRWVDEHGIEYPVYGVEGIRKCPRRVGIVSNGLIKRRSLAADELLKQQYDCVILDEAHHARRRNLGEHREHEAPDPNNLLRFMYEIATHTRSLRPSCVLGFLRLDRWGAIIST